MKKLLFGIIIISLSFSLSAQWHFGGTVENGMSSLLNFEDDYSHCSDRISLSPALQYSGNVLELKAKADLSYDYPENSIDLTLYELYLTYYDYGFWKAQIGRFHYLPGSSEFFSNTNYFSTSDYLRLIENQGKDFYLPGDLFQLSFMGSQLYVKNTVSMTPVYSKAIDADSPWLPKNLLNESIYLFSKGFSYRDSIYTEDPERPEITIEDVSYNLEAGYSSYWFDLALQFYRGWDNSPLNYLKMDMKDENLFDLTIHPVYTKKTALGINAASNLQAFHFWFDGSCTFNKLFQNSTLDLTTNRTTDNRARWFESTVGGRYDFYWQDLTVLFEWKNSSHNCDDSYIITPYLSSAFAGALQLSFADYTHQPRIFMVYDLDDDSWFSALQWEYQLNDRISVEGTAAKLSGGKDSLFGHYKQNYLFSLNMVLKK